LENESRIWEEEGVEEAAGAIHVNNIDAHNKVQIKDIEIQILVKSIMLQDN
jgi:hypothetical protein